MKLADVYDHVIHMRELKKVNKDIMGLLDATGRGKKSEMSDAKRRKYSYTALGLSLCRDL